MSSISKSKSKDKKASKEQKTPLKPTVVVNGGGNALPASAYNPLLGTFHALDTSSTSSPQVLQGNGRFHDIDDTEDHSARVNGGDYDCASNNDTRSGESEEQLKEKSNGPNKQEVIPGVDNDKREKIRQKNERKHQRQKEKRAQELHEKCSGYLMSRKLEALAQQLVSMGFSQERSTMALILNEGRVEEAVAWLFEGGEDSDKHKDQNLDTGNNLKIDISEELSRIAELEIKYKCSKQEVERAIVTCEGDLEKSEETLKSQKQDQPEISPKSEDNGDFPTLSNGKISVSSSQSNIRLLQPKPNPVSLQPHKRDDKDLNFPKATITLGMAPKSVPKPVQPVTKPQPKLEWAKPQQIVTPSKKRWLVGGGSSSSPSVSYSLAPTLQVSPPTSRLESRYISVGDEYKNFQPGSVREPVVMMQRPQSVNNKTSPVTSIGSSPPGGAGIWYPSGSEAMNPNGLMPHIPSSTRSPSPNNNQYYPPQQYQQQNQAFVPNSGPMGNLGSSPINGSFSRVGPPTTLAAASSLGLFSGLGLGLGSSACTSSSLISPVDWNASCAMPSCDYTSIDWSVDANYLPPRPNGLWSGVSGPYSTGNSHMHDSGATTMGGINLGMRPPSSNGPYSTSNSHMHDFGAKTTGFNVGMRPPSSNGSGVPSIGSQNGGEAKGDPTAANSREWTSPFEGKDLFSLPRQFVFSPSL